MSWDSPGKSDRGGGITLGFKDKKVQTQGRVSGNVLVHQSEAVGVDTQVGRGEL